MVIRTFLSNAHEGHNPPAEYLHGQRVPYYEAPQRSHEIERALHAAGLIAPSQAPLMEMHILKQIHDAGMIDFLKDLSENAPQVIGADFAVYDLQDQLTGDEYYYETIFPAQMLRHAAQQHAHKRYSFDNTSPVGRGTWLAALTSASLAYNAADAVRHGARQAYALCRPPGHHAGFDTLGGYCYLNNAAVAAHALKAQGKVAILDVDYHHGNGTQDIFWEDDSVFYLSIHADPAVDYPYYTGYTAENHASNINIPLPHGADAAQYRAALEHAMDAIDHFAPAALVVSLGLDVYKDDPMGKFTLDIPDLRQIGGRIAAAQLPTVYVQEGGYAIEALGALAVAFFTGVLENTDVT